MKKYQLNFVSSDTLRKSLRVPRGVFGDMFSLKFTWIISVEFGDSINQSLQFLLYF